MCVPCTDCPPPPLPPHSAPAVFDAVSVSRIGDFTCPISCGVVFVGHLAQDGAERLAGGAEAGGARYAGGGGGTRKEGGGGAEAEMAWYSRGGREGAGTQRKDGDGQVHGGGPDR